MNNAIVYTKLVNTYRTQTFGNLFRGSFYGMIDPSTDGTWCGWVMDNDLGNEFRLGFASKGAATLWVNDKLRKKGVR